MKQEVRCRALLIRRPQNVAQKLQRVGQEKIGAVRIVVAAEAHKGRAAAIRLVQALRVRRHYHVIVVCVSEQNRQEQLRALDQKPDLAEALASIALIEASDQEDRARTHIKMAVDLKPHDSANLLSARNFPTCVLDVL